MWFSKTPDSWKQVPAITCCVLLSRIKTFVHTVPCHSVLHMEYTHSIGEIKILLFLSWYALSVLTWLQLWTCHWIWNIVGSQYMLQEWMVLINIQMLAMTLVALATIIVVYFKNFLRNWFGDTEGYCAYEPNCNFCPWWVFHFKLSLPKSPPLYFHVGGVRKSASYFISYLHFPLSTAFCAFYDQIAFSHLYLISCKTWFLFAL